MKTFLSKLIGDGDKMKKALASKTGQVRLSKALKTKPKIYDHRFFAIFRDQLGLTLVELMVVCVILAIAFIGLLGLFPLGSKNISESRLRTIAAQLAQEKMEVLLNQSEDSADLTAGMHTDQDNPVRTNFNRYWQVWDNNPVNGMKRIEVWVTYPHGSDLREVRLISQRRG